MVGSASGETSALLWSTEVLPWARLYFSNQLEFNVATSNTGFVGYKTVTLQFVVFTCFNILISLFCF